MVRFLAEQIRARLVVDIQRKRRRRLRITQERGDGGLQALVVPRDDQGGERFATRDADDDVAHDAATQIGRCRRDARAREFVPEGERDAIAFVRVNRATVNGDDRLRPAPIMTESQPTCRLGEHEVHLVAKPPLPGSEDMRYLQR